MNLGHCVGSASETSKAAFESDTENAKAFSVIFFAGIDFLISPSWLVFGALLSCEIGKRGRTGRMVE